MTRRKLLLWGVPAVLVLAVIGAVVTLALLVPPNEALRVGNKLKFGMTIEQVRDVIRMESGALWEFCQGGTIASFRDDSNLVLNFDDDWLMSWDVPLNPSWYDRLRERL